MIRYLKSFLFALALIACVPPLVKAQEQGSDIALISKEPANYAYITHSSTVVGEYYLTPIGEGKTGGFLAANFDGAVGDGKDDLVCIDIDDNEDPYAFIVNSPGNSGSIPWTNSLRERKQDYYYFLTGDYDGDGNDDLATFYRDYASSNPDADVRVKVTYGPNGDAQLNDDEDWLLAEEADSAFVAGRFQSTNTNNDSIYDLGAISKSTDHYIIRFYLGAQGEISATTWDLVPPSITAQPVAFGACDFNNDSNDDIVFVFFDPQDSTYRARISLGQSGLTIKTWNLSNTQFKAFVFQDFNGDRYCDIAGIIENQDGTKAARIFQSLSSGSQDGLQNWDLKANVTTAGYIAGDFGRLKSNVSGRVLRFGGTTGLAGATVTLKLTSSGEIIETAITDTAGNYSFLNHVNDSYTISVSKYGHTFNPSQLPITVFNTSISGVNFISTNDPHVYHISGRVSRKLFPAEGLRGMKLIITGGNDTSGVYTVEATTDDNGNYSAAVSLGEFAVSPVNPIDGEFIFEPQSQDVTIYLGDETGIDFTDDGLDKCPYDITKKDPGVCGCNVVDLDSDSDGTYDCHDLCISDPKKVVPGICGCGRIDVNVNENSRCDWDEITDPNVKKYSIQGRVVQIDENSNILKGVGGIIIRHPYGIVESMTIREAMQIVKSMPKGTNVDDLVGTYKIDNLLSADHNIYIDPNDQGEENGGLKYFDLRRNVGRENCPDRATIQTDSNGQPMKDQNGLPKYLTDQQRIAMGGVVCRYSPLKVERSLVGIDFATQDCTEGWQRNDQGNCVKLSLSSPTGLTASQGSSANYVEISFTGSVGATEYELFALRDPSARGDMVTAATDHGTRIALIRQFEDCTPDRFCSFQDTSPIPGVGYRYHVRAINQFTASNLAGPATGWRKYGEGTEPIDSDGDGSTDEQEISDGTNPFDQGSFETHLRSPVYTKYNTYIDHMNYLELVSSGTKAVRARVTIYSSLGKRIGNSKNVYVRPNSEMDVDINSLVGKKDEIGLVRIDFNHNDEGVNLSGRMSVYRQEVDQDHLPNSERKYSFAYSREFRNPTRGNTFATANTIDPQGLGNEIANWVEIMNVDSVARRFTVRIYNDKGKIVFDSDNDFDAKGRPKSRIVVPARGERDVQGGHGLGQGVFLVEVQPTDGGTNYFTSVTRYGSLTPPGIKYENFNFAFPIDAKSGNGDTQFVPIANLQGQCWSQSNWVEIVNVSGSSVQASMKFRNQRGQLLGSRRITLKPTAQSHFNTGALLPLNGYGTVEIKPNKAGSIIGQSTFYYHDCEENKIQSAYSSPAYISGQESQVGSYNRYLKMNNYVTVMSTSSEKQVFSLDIRNETGSRTAIQEKSIDSYRSSRFDISDPKLFKTKPDSFGQMMFKTNKVRKLMIENVRIRELEGKIDFAFPTAVR